MNKTVTFIPLTELIRARKFDWMSPEITDERFPIPDRLWNDYKKFYFGKNISSREAAERIRAEGYEPANSHELLLWNGWDGEETIISLGSSIIIDGNRPVLYLYRNWRSKPCLRFTWSDGIWNSSSYFLAVREPSDA